MKIRTQFIGSAVLALVAAIAAGIAVWLAALNATAADVQQQRAQEVAREAAGLLVLTQEYALHSEPRAAQQWRQRHAALGVALAAEGEQKDDAWALAGLRRTSAALPEMFARLAGVLGEAPTPLAVRRKEFLVDRILTDTQALADGAYRWSRDAGAAQQAAEQRVHRWGAGAFAMTVALLVAQTLVVVRRVLHPMMKLQAATQAVERGELGVRLRADVHDELGDLQRHFNAMTTALGQRTDELEQEIALRGASELRIRTITDNLPVLISYIDHDERLQFVNATFREWMGINPEQALGRKLVEVIGTDLYEQRRSYRAQALRGERVTFDVMSESLGTRRYLHNVYVPDVRPDGSVAGIYTLSSDVTPLKLVQERLIKLARADALTGLPNRRCFDEKMAEAVARARREQRAMALLYLDVDHFKQINDRHGHGVGDEVLKELAARLRACVRITDSVARLAGDEFVVILEGLNSSAEAELVAQKVGEALVPRFGETTCKLAVTCSIGVAYAEPNEVSSELLIATADRALYRAKRAGRATFALSVCTTDNGNGRAAA